MHRSVAYAGAPRHPPGKLSLRMENLTFSSSSTQGTATFSLSLRDAPSIFTCTIPVTSVDHHTPARSKMMT